ncbi:MAG: hypothetical protein QOE83_345 [Actinomycetota bacterium]|jgi:hypothetical protein|nr:hypothetical protein [Actinomycetota bacterium]
MIVTENPVRRRRRRHAPLVGALAVMVGALSVAPVAAEVIRGSDISPYRFSYDDCGFTVDVDGVFSSPHSMARVGRHKDASAFFGHDRYMLTETHTRRGTDTEVVIVAHGLLHDVRVTRISGSVFEFTMMDVAHTELYADGTLLGREDGQIRRTFLFDTLGDETPGGEFVELLTERFSGRFGGIDTCAALAEP